MEESDFRSGCPIATTMPESAPHPAKLTRVGNDAFDQWIAIMAPIVAADGTSTAKPRTKAQTLISAMERALLLARVRNSRPIMDIAKGDLSSAYRPPDRSYSPLTLRRTGGAV